MTHRVEELDSCTKKLVFDFDATGLADRIKRSLADKRQRANLKGFRKGKAPMDLIRKFYGPQVESSVVHDFALEQSSKALQEEGWPVIGRPSIDKVDYDLNGKISFELMVEVIPELELANLSSLSFTRAKAAVTEEEREDFIAKNYLEAVAESRESKDPQMALQKGHLAVISFQGTLPDGNSPENMQSQEFLLEVGKGALIPGFEEGLLGMKKGEKRVLDLTFPKDYHHREVQGSKVTFDVELLEIKEKILPALNDELAKSFECESVDDLREKVYKMLEGRKQGEINRQLDMDIISKIIETNPFEVPKGMLQEKRESIEKALQEYSLEVDKIEKMAMSQAKETILFLFLAKKHDITVVDSEVDAVVDTLDKSNITEEVRGNIREMIFKKKIFEKIYSSVQIVEK